MTGNVKVGLIRTGNIDRGQAENFAFRISGSILVVVSNLFVEAAERHLADYPIPTGYNDHHLILADNLNVSHPQFIKEPGSTNSISFPPFCCWEQERPPAPGNFK